MAILFDGYKEAEIIYQNIRAQLKDLQDFPSLAIARIGEQGNTVGFTEKKKEAADMLGIKCDIYHFTENAAFNEIKSRLMNISQTHTGVMIQVPVPDHLNRFDLFNLVPFKKDVEGLSAKRIGEILQKHSEIYSPAARGVMLALSKAQDTLEFSTYGRRVTFIGNSYLSSVPLTQILYRQGATINICGPHTRDLEANTKESDIVIAGSGVKHLIKSRHIKEGAVVIDVGFGVDHEGIYGDTHPDVADTSGFYSPVPGGIGPLTIAYIFDNLLKLHQKS